MKKRFILIAAVCAVAIIYCAGCKEDTVWTNAADMKQEDAADEKPNVTEKEQETVTDGKSDITEIETDTGTGTDREQKTDADTGVEAAEMGDSRDKEAIIVIYICGAVVNPGVYELPSGARVIQAVEAAGGLLENADPFLVNQAKKLDDGEQIRILTRDEAEEAAAGVFSGIQTSDTPGNGKVNINTADAEQLMTLPGIGQAKAKAILEYREQNGGFRSIEEIMNIAGIKDAVFSKIKDQITVS